MGPAGTANIAAPADAGDQVKKWILHLLFDWLKRFMCTYKRDRVHGNEDNEKKQAAINGQGR